MAGSRRRAAFVFLTVAAALVVAAAVATNLPGLLSFSDVRPPVVTATANPATGTAPLTVHFTAATSGGISPLTYRWTFGDGSSASGASVSHTYSDSGAYIATVVVTDDRGRSDSTSVTVTVNAPPSPSCKTSDPSSGASCFEATVARVIDGDTLEADDGTHIHRIRLVLVDAPELSEAGGPEAREYLTSLCLGKQAVVDEDDFQVGDDPYGRVLAVVYCAGTNANAAMISSGHADTYFSFCSASEFGSEAWAGCSSPPPPKDCDPAYPDVCIPPPPPDLDCSDIPYRNFRVLPPDPHHFDGDGDGIGCEGG